MPVRTVRSGTRGLPPLGLDGSGGSNGPITSHNPLLTKASGIILTSDLPTGLALSAARSRQHHAGQHDRSSCRLPGPQGLAEDRPGQRRRDRR
jgi:hypothetical protein